MPRGIRVGSMRGIGLLRWWSKRDLVTPATGLRMASLQISLHPLAPALLSHAGLEVRGLANILAELLAHLGAVHIHCL